MNDRTRVKRLPQRARYEREAIAAILDEALVCHLGFLERGKPVVIPTLQARIDDHVYVHGSSAGRTLKELGAGASICLTATLIDGLVLARSAFHHSVNYRSVVVFGEAESIDDPAGKLRALEAFTDKLVPGRWPDVRKPTRQELKATSVVRLPLDESSAKVREGPPLDDEPDYELGVWAGVVPLELTRLEPRADPRLAPGTRLPSYLI